MRITNTLIIGGGGREHALALALSKSPNIGKLYAVPGNPGIANIAECCNVPTENTEAIISLCKEKTIEFVVIGPEQPIANGLSDKLTAQNIAVFAPSKFASQLESSKSFAKKFMSENNIPTAKYAVFDKSELLIALDYLAEMSAPIVIKADGLAAGKGVVIAESKTDAIEAIKEFFGGKFGTASEKIVIEEFMKGEEISVFAICDGKDFVVLPPAQDRKRIGEGDTGKNTGGMGAYTPVSLCDEELITKIKEKIIKPTLLGMEKMRHPYIGCLYVGLMINDNYPKVVEYNVRFGDPETQAIMSIFCGDLLKLLHSAANKNIYKNAYDKTETEKKTACCVVIASEGYPDKYETGKIIEGISTAQGKGAIVYHSGTKLTTKGLVTAGGRVLSVVAVNEEFETAVNTAYQGAESVKFDNAYYRRDITVLEERRLLKQLK